MTSREAVTRRENWNVKGNCFRHVSQKRTLNSSAFTVTTFAYSQCWVTVKILVSETFGITRLHTWVDSHSRVYTTRFKRQRTDVMTQRDVTHVMSLIMGLKQPVSPSLPNRAALEFRQDRLPLLEYFWQVARQMYIRLLHTRMCVSVYTPTRCYFHHRERI